MMGAFLLILAVTQIRIIVCIDIQCTTEVSDLVSVDEAIASVSCTDAAQTLVSWYVNVLRKQITTPSNAPTSVAFVRWKQMRMTFAALGSQIQLATHKMDCRLRASMPSQDAAT